MKPGIQSTEWWGTLIVHLVTLITVGGSVFSKSLDVSGLNALIPSLSVVASGIAQGAYSHGRSLVKVANVPTPVAVAIPLPSAPVPTVAVGGSSSAMPR